MATFISRRLLVSVLILLGASFIVYVLTAYSGDPLEDLRQVRTPNRDQLIAQRISELQLNVPAPLRFFLWLGGAAKCLIPFANACNLGLTTQHQKVTELLPMAMGSTIQLVTTATVLAIVLGVTIGIVSALRQYSGFDLSITFISFLLYSLPAFWVAVLLKEFLAIGYNNFLRNPVIPLGVLVAIAVLSGVIWQALLGGPGRRRLTVAGIAALATAAVLAYVTLTDWFAHPALGPMIIAVSSAGIALALIGLTVGIRNRRGLIAGGMNVIVAIIAYFSLQGLFAISSPSTLLILAIVVVSIGLVSGYLVGGPDRGANVRIGAFTALLSFGLILIDRFMQSWPSYVDVIGGRPIATVGSETPSLGGDVWIGGLDSFTHLLLPTVSLMLISFAGYTRYARAGMLDVLNQDYIRTARAKGLPERVVVVRHALRNSLVPIATIVALDFGAILGGAIITEQIFGFSGMGQLFQTGLKNVDVNPVMGYFVVIATMTLAFNFIADLTYSALDPRVRTR
jgi:peptide/nickel transport system permease protein